MPLATFVDYGLDFQRRFVPALDVRSVIGLRSRGDNFELRLEDGEVVGARRVILAVGIAHFDYMPPCSRSSLPNWQRIAVRITIWIASRIATSPLSERVPLRSTCQHCCLTRAREYELVARTSALRFGSDLNRAEEASGKEFVTRNPVSVRAYDPDWPVIYRICSAISHHSLGWR